MVKCWYFGMGLVSGGGWVGIWGVSKVKKLDLVGID